MNGAERSFRHEFTFDAESRLGSHVVSKIEINGTYDNLFHESRRHYMSIVRSNTVTKIETEETENWFQFESTFDDRKCAETNRIKRIPINVTETDVIYESWLHKSFIDSNADEEAKLKEAETSFQHEVTFDGVECMCSDIVKYILSNSTGYNLSHESKLYVIRSMVQIKWQKSKLKKWKIGFNFNLRLIRTSATRQMWSNAVEETKIKAENSFQHEVKYNGVACVGSVVVMYFQINDTGYDLPHESKLYDMSFVGWSKFIKRN